MDFWKNIYNKLQNRQQVYLLTVVKNSGSSPGRQTFKMAVAQDGTIFGSIGGGVMEYKLVEKAKKFLQKNENPVLLIKQVHQAKTENSSGMICSGEQTVTFHPLTRVHLTSIKQLINQKQNADLHLTQNDVVFNFDSKSDKPIFSYKSKTNWQYTEPLNQKETVYIVGSGHVGLAVSEICQFLDFQVQVFDNRKKLNTFEQNTFTYKKQIIDYNTISNYIPNKPNAYVIIMTNKYTDDKLVLEKLLQNNPLHYKYIGVLGSKAKIEIMFKDLLEKGYNKHDLNQIYTPIGISIKSQTPQEIAISIGAEIISVKNNNH